MNRTNRVINPYIAGSPVRDRAMFYGRERVFETIQSCLIESQPPQIVILHGQRRMGKTSTLYQVSWHLPERYIPVLIDLQGISLDGLSSLLWEMAQVLRRRLRRAANIVLPRQDREAWFADARTGIGHFFDALGREAGERHIVLMFDETMLLVDKIGAGALEEQVFACFSELMSEYSFLDFIFSVGSKVGQMKDELGHLSRPATYCELGFLEPDAARALICEPVGDMLSYEPQAIEDILTLTSGQPYYTQLVCHALFNRVQAAGRHSIGQADVEAVRADVVDLATAQLHYVWDETPRLGQRVLLALAEIQVREERAHSVAQIGRILLDHGVGASDEQIQESILDLGKRKIIYNRKYYCFHINLLLYWILKYRRYEWM